MQEIKSKKILVVNVLRWLAVLLTSIVLYFLVNAIWSLLYYLTISFYYDNGSILSIIYKEVMGEGLAIAAFIFGGSYVAPFNRKLTGLILTVIVCVVYGGILFYINFITKEYFLNIAIISGLITAGASLLEVQKHFE